MIDDNILFKERVKRSQEFVGHLLSEMDSYHNHKETMAHGAFLVMLAICGAILAKDKWPPVWIDGFAICKSVIWIITLISVIFLWFFIHVYIRWQLRNRREAAIKYNGALRALADWSVREPNEQDLILYQPKIINETKSCLVWIDKLFIPYPITTIHLKIAKDGYPAWLGKAIEREEMELGPICAEWLVTIGSFLALVIILIRIW